MLFSMVVSYAFSHIGHFFVDGMEIKDLAVAPEIWFLVAMAIAYLMKFSVTIKIFSYSP